MKKSINNREYTCKSCNETKTGIRYLPNNLTFCFTNSKKYLCPKCYRLKQRIIFGKIRKITKKHILHSEHLKHGFRKYLSNNRSIDTNDILNAHKHMLKHDEERIETSMMKELILDNKREITRKFNEINGEIKMEETLYTANCKTCIHGFEDQIDRKSIADYENYCDANNVVDTFYVIENIIHCPHYLIKV